MPSQNAFFQVDQGGLVGCIVFSNDSRSYPFFTKKRGIQTAQEEYAKGRMNEEQYEMICQYIRGSNLMEEDGYLDMVSDELKHTIFNLEQKIKHLQRRIRDEDDGAGWWRKE